MHSKIIRIWNLTERFYGNTSGQLEKLDKKLGNTGDIIFLIVELVD